MAVAHTLKTKGNVWQFAGHLLFFGSLYFVYSPFFVLPAPVRFGGFAALLLCGAALIMDGSLRRLEGLAWIILAFLVLYGIAVLRMNEMLPGKPDETIFLNYQMAMLSMLAFVTSAAISTSVDMVKMRRALLLVSVPCGLWICYNYRDLSDYSTAGTYFLGYLNYSSYQLTSLLLAIGALSALAEIDFAIPMSRRNLLAAPIFLLFGYYVFQGLGRGEALAFAAAVAFYIAPRISLIALPFAYSILMLAVNMFNTPLTERMQLIMDGNYGARDELLLYSLALLENEPLTLLTGGGLNYFQSYWKFSSGTYPHNIPVETVISGGILLFLLYFLVYFVPVLRGLFLLLSRRFYGETSYVLCLSIMLLLITFKSGTLLTFWTLGMFTCAFLHLNSVVAQSRRPEYAMRRSSRQQFSWQNGVNTIGRHQPAHLGGSQFLINEFARQYSMQQFAMEPKGSERPHSYGGHYRKHNQPSNAA